MWIIDLSVKTQNYKTRRRKHRRKSLSPSLRQKFLRYNIQSKSVNKLSWIPSKFKMFVLQKAMWTEWKVKVTDFEKVFAKQKTQDNKCWWGWGVTRTLTHCWWEFKLCRTLKKFLTMLNIYFMIQQIPLLGTCLLRRHETRVHRTYGDEHS